MVILAAGAVFAGLIPFGEYVSSDGRVFALHTDWAFSVLPLTLSIGGILIATWMYLKQNERSDRAAAFFAGFYRAARSKFFLDELYGFVTKKIIFRFIGAPAAWIDRSIVDGAVNTMVLPRRPAPNRSVNCRTDGFRRMEPGWLPVCSCCCSSPSIT